MNPFLKETKMIAFTPCASKMRNIYFMKPCNRLPGEYMRKILTVCRGI